MGLFQSLAMLLILLTLPSPNMAQSIGDVTALDALLQDYAYRAFVRPKTGVAYDGIVPSNLTGIKISVMRFRSGSLRKYGVSMYKEFVIPTGVGVQPYVERLVLVYQNLANWSMAYYPLPGYTYLAPVISLLAYDAFNLSATNLPKLDLKAAGNPISIHFSNVKSAPDGSEAKCVSFNRDGSVNFSEVGSENVCSTFDDGHFGLVAESISPAPAPAPSPVSPSPTHHKGKKTSNKVWIIVGSVVGGLLLLGLLAFLVLWARKYKQRKKMHQMERAAEVGEALQMTSVGESRAPAARVTRTQPTLENEYVP
ncbi:hypothetical protein ACFE04_001412 [Oxalis oulophora]